MKKVSKEAANQDICAKLRKIGNVFFSKREVSTQEAIKTLILANEILKYSCNFHSQWNSEGKN